MLINAGVFFTVLPPGEGSSIISVQKILCLKENSREFAGMGDICIWHHPALLPDAPSKTTCAIFFFFGILRLHHCCKITSDTSERTVSPPVPTPHFNLVLFQVDFNRKANGLH